MLSLGIWSADYLARLAIDTLPEGPTDPWWARF
jgi:hypothetical protein